MTGDAGRLRSPPAKSLLTVATSSDSMVCKVKSSLSHLSSNLLPAIPRASHVR
jgi:hypothetical protein